MTTVLAAILIGCSDTNNNQGSNVSQPVEPNTATEEVQEQTLETADSSSESVETVAPEAEEAVAEIVADVVEEEPLPPEDLDLTAEDTASEATDSGNADTDEWQIDYDHPFAPITEAEVVISWDESNIKYFEETGQLYYNDGMCAPVVEIEGSSVERTVEQDGSYHIEFITIKDIEDHVRIEIYPCVPSNDLPYDSMIIGITDVSTLIA